MYRFAATLLVTALLLAPTAFATERPISTGCLLTDAEVSAVVGAQVTTHRGGGSASAGLARCTYTAGYNDVATIEIKTLPYFLAEKALGNPFGTGSVQGEWDEGKKWMKKRYPIAQIDGLGKDAYFYPKPAKTTPAIVYVLLDDLHLEASSQSADRKQLEALARAVVQKMPPPASE